MKVDRALELISILANGVDPYTGEVLPEDSLYQNPEIIRALFLAKESLQKLSNKERRLGKLPEKAGNPWSEKEDKDLINKFNEGVTIKELAKIHARTEWAIHRRLNKLGKITN